MNVALRTHKGKEVRFYDDLIKDEIVLINFMYTRCIDGICIPTSANLEKVHNLFGERIGRDIFIYSITLDPEYDTPEVLKKYAEGFDAKPGWHFLTGKKEDIERLRKKLGYVSPVPEEDKKKSYHVGMLRFGNEPLERRGGCHALTKPKWIAQYVQWLEPKNGRPKSKL
jgi:protein SCO1/2